MATVAASPDADRGARTPDGPARRPLFPGLATLVLFACLLVPFGVRLLSDRLEAYPAILLPSGAATVEAGATEVSFRRVQIWGRGADGAWQPIDAPAFLRPIPIQYLNGIVNNRFGLVESSATEPVLLRHVWKTVDLPRHVPDAEARAATRAWLAGRLRALGFAPDVIRATVEQFRVAIPGGRVIERATVDEQIHALD